MGDITTEIRPAPEFFFAEAYHQQYLDKNPNGYCPNHATGVTLPADFFKSAGSAQRAAAAAKAIGQGR
jgi:peptide-methionine (S)-S-oxide reductase